MSKMKQIKGKSKTPKWLDTRFCIPTTNHFDIYYVVYKSCGMTMLGKAEFIPKNNYTTGEWGEVTSTNGNKQGKCEVLYWRQHPTIDIDQVDVPHSETRKVK